MSVHTRQDLERLSRFTRQRFSHAIMSDTKWRKLFTAVDGSDWKPSLVAVKFVGSNEAESTYMRWPGPNSFWGPPQWVDTPEFGPIELRSIEWLLIPSTVVAHGLAGLAEHGTPQDQAAITAALERIGHFPLEDTPEGLKVTGYRK
jgi:hypothetical protein